MIQLRTQRNQSSPSKTDQNTALNNKNVGTQKTLMKSWFVRRMGNRTERPDTNVRMSNLQMQMQLPGTVFNCGQVSRETDAARR